MKPLDLFLVPVSAVWGLQMFSWNVPVTPGLLGVANACFLLWLLLEVRK